MLEDRRRWLACLTALDEADGNIGGLFAGLAAGRLLPVASVALCGVGLSGDMAYAAKWHPALAAPPPDPDWRFRVVFLGEPGDLPQDVTLDPRVAVVVPGPASTSALTLAAEYEAAPTEARHELLPRLLEAQRETYRAGAIRTSQDLGLEAAELLAEDHVESWARAIGSALVRHVYHRLPTLVPQRAFGADRVLQPDDVPALFEAFVRPERVSRAHRASLGAFALGLGLCWRDSMWDLRSERSPLGGLVCEWLAGGAVDASVIYSRLTRPPYGLPTSLVTLRLLLLVAHPHTGVRIKLAPDHQLHTLAGAPFPDDSIRRDNLRSLAWPTDPQRAFHIVEAVGSDLDPALPFAKVLVPDIDADEDEQRGARRLGSALAELKERVDACRALLHERICRPTELRLPPELSAALEGLSSLTQATDSGDLEQAARDAFESPSDLEQALALLADGEEYAAMADDLAAMHRFLHAARIPPAYADMHATRDLLRRQLGPGGTVAGPNVCRALLGRFQAFRNEYRRTYERRHREVNEARATLRRRLEVATPTLDAVQRLDRIEELGLPSARGLYERQQILFRRTTVCLATGPLLEGDALACPECGLALDDAPPHAEVDRFLWELQKAYHARATALGRALANRVLAQGGSDQLRALHDALQLSHVHDLEGLLTDDLVRHLRRLLRREPASVVPSDVFERVAQQFPAVTESQVEDATAAFRESLIRALLRAKSQNADGDAEVRLSPPE
ncbi:MAG: hypothetical protein ACE5O2_02900 [Armatimonadota bacterium]